MTDFIKQLDKLIEKAMKKELSKSKKPETTIQEYKDIEDYQRKTGTGKRFRMLKEQKERGLTREEAFAEMFRTK
jgi:flagellar biosynthesis chaperone FliJ